MILSSAPHLASSLATGNTQQATERAQPMHPAWQQTTRNRQPNAPSYASSLATDNTQQATERAQPMHPAWQQTTGNWQQIPDLQNLK